MANETEEQRASKWLSAGLGRFREKEPDLMHHVQEETQVARLMKHLEDVRERYLPEG